MLKKSKTALLLSAHLSFSDPYKELAESIGVEMHVDREWSTKYRVREDVVILGAKFLPNVNETYYDRVVLILGTGESPAPYIKQGIRRFIFNYKNPYELLTALYYEETKVVVARGLGSVVDAITDSGTAKFELSDYDFRFDKGVFFYKQRQIYLTEAQRKYLAEWLLTGNKDNGRRMILCNLRKKFGEDFLSDIDRFGRLK